MTKDNTELPYDPDKVRAEVAAWQKDGGFKEKKNAYQCEECASWIVTIDREQGVTPFMVGCGKCGAMAQSKMYRVSCSMEPTHEWFRPETLEGLSQWSADHVRNGGLLLRRIGGGDAKDGWQTEDALPPTSDTHREVRAAKLIEQLEREQREIEDAVKTKFIRKRRAPDSPRREDYPSRQAYRHACTLQRKGRLN